MRFLESSNQITIHDIVDESLPQQRIAPLVLVVAQDQRHDRPRRQNDPVALARPLGHQDDPAELRDAQDPLRGPHVDGGFDGCENLACACRDSVRYRFAFER